MPSAPHGCAAKQVVSSPWGGPLQGFYEEKLKLRSTKRFT
jgi:hypothetical protein